MEKKLLRANTVRPYGGLSCGQAVGRRDDMYRGTNISVRGGIFDNLMRNGGSRRMAVGFPLI